MNKEQAFSEYVGTDYEEDSDENPINVYPNNVFEYLNEEYLVLTDEEADELCAQKIKESLWAFNIDFLIPFLDCPDKFQGIEVEEFLRCMRSVQEKMCENANSLIQSLIGRNLSWLITEAIACDGRGHFLAAYDGEENECEGYFIYRMN